MAARPAWTTVDTRLSSPARLLPDPRGGRLSHKLKAGLCRLCESANPNAGSYRK